MLPKVPVSFLYFVFIILCVSASLRLRGKKNPHAIALCGEKHQIILRASASRGKKLSFDFEIQIMKIKTEICQRRYGMHREGLRPA